MWGLRIAARSVAFIGDGESCKLPAPITAVKMSGAVGGQSGGPAFGACELIYLSGIPASRNALANSEKISGTIPTVTDQFCIVKWDRVPSRALLLRLLRTYDRVASTPRCAVRGEC